MKYMHIRTFNYIVKDTSRESLKKNGWYYSLRYSGPDESYYIYTFPVYQTEKKVTVLECELIVNQDTHSVDIEVRDSFNNPYAAFYDNKYSKPNIVLLEVENNIKNKMRKLGIVREHNNK